jgi:hypothetical protein
MHANLCSWILEEGISWSQFPVYETGINLQEGRRMNRNVRARINQLIPRINQTTTFNRDIQAKINVIIDRLLNHAANGLDPTSLKKLFPNFFWCTTAILSLPLQ